MLFRSGHFDCSETWPEGVVRLDSVDYLDAVSVYWSLCGGVCAGVRGFAVVKIGYVLFNCRGRSIIHSALGRIGDSL